MKNKKIIKEYAYGKFHELINELFIDIDPARKKLYRNMHLIFAIVPNDFTDEKHQVLWNDIQTKLKRKIRNYGTIKRPQESLTVQNKTLKFVLEAIWKLYDECADPEDLA